MRLSTGFMHQSHCRVSPLRGHFPGGNCLTGYANPTRIGPSGSRRYLEVSHPIHWVILYLIGLISSAVTISGLGGIAQDDVCLSRTVPARPSSSLRKLPDRQSGRRALLLSLRRALGGRRRTLLQLRVRFAGWRALLSLVRSTSRDPNSGG